MTRLACCCTNDAYRLTLCHTTELLSLSLDLALSLAISLSVCESLPVFFSLSLSLSLSLSFWLLYEGCVPADPAPQGWGLRVEGSWVRGFRVEGYECRVSVSGLGVEGVRLRVQGLCFGV